MPRKPKFAADNQPTSPTTLRLPLDVSEAILGDQQTRDRATDAVVRAVRRESKRQHTRKAKKGT